MVRGTSVRHRRHLQGLRGELPRSRPSATCARRGPGDRERGSVGPAMSPLHSDIDGFESLSELALDMRWSWNHAADDLWQQLDPELWELTHNPWAVLQTVSRKRLKSASADPM